MSANSAQGEPSCPIKNGNCTKESVYLRVEDGETLVRLLHNDDIEDGEIASRFLPTAHIIKGDGGWSFIRYCMVRDDARLKEIAALEMPKGPAGYDYYVGIEAGIVRRIANGVLGENLPSVGICCDGGKRLGRNGAPLYDEHVSVENCVFMKKAKAKRIREKMLLIMEKRKTPLL